MDILEIINNFNRELEKPMDKAKEILHTLSITQIEKYTKLSRSTIRRLRDKDSELNKCSESTIHLLAYLYDEFVSALNHSIEK